LAEFPLNYATGVTAFTVLQPSEESLFRQPKHSIYIYGSCLNCSLPSFITIFASSAIQKIDSNALRFELYEPRHQHKDRVNRESQVFTSRLQASSQSPRLLTDLTIQLLAHRSPQDCLKHIQQLDQHACRCRLPSMPWPSTKQTSTTSSKILNSQSRLGFIMATRHQNIATRLSPLNRLL